MGVTEISCAAIVIYCKWYRYLFLSWDRANCQVVPDAVNSVIRPKSNAIHYNANGPAAYNSHTAESIDDNLTAA